MTNSKIIETIKKLLALASSPNENEAKLAMKRAQDLIAQHSISLIDDIEEQIIETQINYTKLCIGTSEFAPYIMRTICQIFGVHLVKLSRKPIVSLFGYKTNIEVALHACSCILNQLNADLRTKINKHNSYNYVNDYWLSASQVIRDRFKEESKIGEGLVLYDKANELLRKTYVLVQDRDTSILFGSQGLTDGSQAGSQVQLRSGVTQSSGEVKRIL